MAWPVNWVLVLAEGAGPATASRIQESSVTV
jgi:hypothetical protein